MRSLHTSSFPPLAQPDDELLLKATRHLQPSFKVNDAQRLCILDPKRKKKDFWEIRKKKVANLNFHQSHGAYFIFMSHFIEIYIHKQASFKFISNHKASLSTFYKKLPRSIMIANKKKKTTATATA